MSKKQLIYLSTYIVFFIVLILLPIFMMKSCSGWNESMMGGGNIKCFVDISLYENIVRNLYNIIFMSVFMGFLPVIFYIVCVFKFANFTGEYIYRRIEEKENH